jgi:hypothetical protein
MKNSFNDRCLAAGVRRDWAGWDNGWVFKGIYGYVGEFFFDTFDDCGDHGSYHDFKKATGNGRRPYPLDHGYSLHAALVRLILEWMWVYIPSCLSLRHNGALDKSVNHVCSAALLNKSDFG